MIYIHIPEEGTMFITTRLNQTVLPSEKGNNLQDKRDWYKKYQEQTKLRIIGFDPDRPEVPPIIEETLRYLHSHQTYKMEGIFRLSAPLLEVQNLKKLYERGS